MEIEKAQVYETRYKAESRDDMGRGRRSRSSEDTCESRRSKGRKVQTAETKPNDGHEPIVTGNAGVSGESGEPYEARVSRTVL